MRVLAIGVAVAILSGCDGSGLNIGLPSLGGDAGDSEIVVTRDEIRLVAPRGFCVDPQTTRRAAASAFVMFGNCAAITGRALAPQPAVNAIITATVREADPLMPKIAESSATLGRFFNSDVGKILISRDNTSSSVTVKESGSNADGAFFLYAEDTSDGAPEGTESTYWRAYLDAKNSVVTISILSLDANPLTRAEGLSLLRQMSGAIDTVSTPNTASAVRPTERPNGSEVSAQPRKAGFLGRLFG